MLGIFKQFWLDESGAMAVEYALLLSVLGVGAVSAWQELGESVVNTVLNVADAIERAGGN